jgi:hypothetical protein
MRSHGTQVIRALLWHYSHVLLLVMSMKKDVVYRAREQREGKEKMEQNSHRDTSGPSGTVANPEPGVAPTVAERIRSELRKSESCFVSFYVVCEE